MDLKLPTAENMKLTKSYKVASSLPSKTKLKGLVINFIGTIQFASSQVKASEACTQGKANSLFTKCSNDLFHGDP